MIERLLHITAEACRITVGDIIGPRRKPHMVRARHIAAFVARTLLYQKFETIGALLGRDHATAMHSYRMVRKAPEAFEPELSAVTQALAGVGPMVSREEELAFVRLRLKDLESENAMLRRKLGKAA